MSTKSKKKKAGAGKIILLILAVIVIGGNIVNFIKSPGRGQCRDIIQEFQTSCNSLDVKGMVNCLKPSIANPLKAALFVGEMASSQDSGELLAQFLEAVGGTLNFAGGGSNIDMPEAFSTMTLEPRRYGWRKPARKVQCKATFTVSGIEFEQYVNIYITKSRGEIYIAKISFEK